MRKRVVIGVVALVVGAGIAAFVFKPSEDPIEYHKRKFFEASNGQSWTERIRNFRDKILGQTTFSLSELEHHRDALHKLGYLEEREFVFTNRTRDEVMNVMATSSPPGLDPSHLHFYVFEVSVTNTNVLRLLTVKGDLEKWAPYLIDSKDWRSPDSKAPEDRRTLHKRYTR